MDAGGRTRTITREVLQQAAGDLRRLAEKRKPHETIPSAVTHPQLVKVLRREIAAAFRQGYEVEDVILLLSRQGIDIEATTFRRYWRRANNPGRSTKTKPQEKTGGARLSEHRATLHADDPKVAKNIEPINDTAHSF